jgi:hypothetical protein
MRFFGRNPKKSIDSLKKDSATLKFTVGEIGLWFGRWLYQVLRDRLFPELGCDLNQFRADLRMSL